MIVDVMCGNAIVTIASVVAAHYAGNALAVVQDARIRTAQAVFSSVQSAGRNFAVVAWKHARNATVGFAVPAWQTVSA